MKKLLFWAQFLNNLLKKKERMELMVGNLEFLKYFGAGILLYTYSKFPTCEDDRKGGGVEGGAQCS